MSEKTERLTNNKSSRGGRGKILVIVSSEDTLVLQNGKAYATGYFVNELTVPVRAFMDHDYSVVFANPKGNEAPVDVHSDTAFYFGGSESKRQDYGGFRDGLAGLKNPMKTADVVAGGLDGYEAGPWISNTLRDRELITGQNPFSDATFSKQLLEVLDEKRRQKAA